MNLLLDTHVLLWWLNDDPGLERGTRNAIAEGRNVVFVSAAVIWEIRIKAAIGKLELPPSFRSVLEQQPFLNLDVTAEHVHAIADLPFLHRDPFDRILVAQAKVEHLTLVTRDARLREYLVPILEA